MRIAPRFTLLALLLAALGAKAQVPGIPAAPATSPAQSSALDGALFYQLLLGELNANGDEPGAAFSLMLDAARKTGDPRLYQRSVEIALKARSGDSALQAARAWRQALPNSREANRYTLQILIGMNRLAETVEPLKREIANAEAKDRALAVTAIPRYFARASDKKLPPKRWNKRWPNTSAQPPSGLPPGPPLVASGSRPAMAALHWTPRAGDKRLTPKRRVPPYSHSR